MRPWLIPTRLWSTRVAVELGESGCPSAIPRMRAGPCLASAARSAEETTTAVAPSVSMQQSKRWKGVVIMREAWWSSMVIGARMIAFSFMPAWRRMVTATAPRCSLVVP